jgi:hypothetical protein
LTDRDREEVFQQVLASFLRDDLAPAGPSCLAPGVAAAYYAGSLSEPEAGTVEIHLAGCAPCQAEIALLARLEASGLEEIAVPRAALPAAESTDKAVTPIAPHQARREDPSASRSVQATSQVTPSQPSAVDDDERVSESTLTKERAPIVLRHDAEWFPRGRRTRWTWIGAAGLSVAAILAISVTYRFAPLVDEASRRASDTDSVASPTRTDAAKNKDAEEFAPPLSPPQEAQPAPTAAPFFSDEPSEDKAAVMKESAPQAAAGELASTAPQAPVGAVEPPAPASPEARPEDHKRAAPAANEQSLAKAKQETSQAGAGAPAARALTAPAASALAATGARPVVVVARSNLDVTWRLSGTTIERSDDAGKTWRRQAAVTETPLLAGSAPSDAVCWVAGVHGTVLRSSDGTNWERLSSPTSADIVQITAWSMLNASIRTASGERFSTEDGGLTWSKP